MTQSSDEVRHLPAQAARYMPAIEAVAGAVGMENGAAADP